MSRFRTVALLVVLALAPQAAYAVCDDASGGGLTCSAQSSVTASAAAIRAQASRLRTSICITAVAANSAAVRCGPMTVTTTSGVEINPTGISGYCWNEKQGSNFFADADIGCISTSGTQAVVATENYQ